MCDAVCERMYSTVWIVISHQPTVNSHQTCHLAPTWQSVVDAVL